LKLCTYIWPEDLLTKGSSVNLLGLTCWRTACRDLWKRASWSRSLARGPLGHSRL